jgi:lipopolysaccharide biosynthesis regulator YciM
LWFQNHLYAAILGIELVIELAQVTQNERVEMLILDHLVGGYGETQYWEKAEAAYDRWNSDILTNSERPGADEAHIEIEYAQLLFMHKKDFDTALVKLNRAENLTKEPGIRRIIALNLGVVWLQLGNPENALVQLERARASAFNARQDLKEIDGWIAQAFLRLGHKNKVRELLRSGVDDINAAELWLAIKENEEEFQQARKYALDAY